MRDLVCHLINDAQDVLITRATPSNATPTRDAVTYWEVLEPPPTGGLARTRRMVEQIAGCEFPVETFDQDPILSAPADAFSLRPGPANSEFRCRRLPVFLA
ncbi:hypothetical protein HNP40_003376 [Mycobacteroides chelonae]|nr:hypothetical protein [Mycobacteroides chelonae]